MQRTSRKRPNASKSRHEDEGALPAGAADGDIVATVDGRPGILVRGCREVVHVRERNGGVFMIERVGAASFSGGRRLKKIREADRSERETLTERALSWCGKRWSLPLHPRERDIDSATQTFVDHVLWDRKPSASGGGGGGGGLSAHALALSLAGAGLLLGGPIGAAVGGGVGLACEAVGSRIAS
jgi:hypothetical protein